MRVIQFNGAESKSFGEVDPGYTGRWVIQIVANPGGLTFTPQVSADDENYVTRAVTPADGSADVTSLTGTGLWIMDALTCFAQLTSAGAGAATVVVLPAIG